MKFEDLDRENFDKYLQEIKKGIENAKDMDQLEKARLELVNFNTTLSNKEDYAKLYVTSEQSNTIVNCFALVGKKSNEFSKDRKKNIIKEDIEEDIGEDFIIDFKEEIENETIDNEKGTILEIDLNITDEKYEDKVEKKLSEMLKEREVIQKQIMLATLAKSARKAKDTVTKEKEKLSNYLTTQAEVYGANKEKIAEIVKDYEDKLKMMQEAAEIEKNSLTKEIAGHEKDERKAIHDLRKAQKAKETPEYKNAKVEYERLKTEMIKAIDEGKDEQAETIKEKLKLKRATILKYDEDIKDNEEKINHSRTEVKQKRLKIKENDKLLNEEVTANKVSELVKDAQDKKELTKQSGFQKFIGGIVHSINKIGGEGKFNKKIIKPINQAISAVGEQIKSIPQNVVNTRDKIVRELKMSLQQSIKDKKVKLEELQQEQEQYKSTKDRKDHDVVVLE